jgi:receptor protein-tyrosine kinase
MSRVSDALRRAGEEQPAPTAQEFDVFRSESGREVPSTDAAAAEAPLAAQPDRRPPPALSPGNASLPPIFSSFNKAVAEKLVVSDSAPPEMLEEFRRLAALLHHAQLAHGTKVVMVTSAAPAEGKTLTATNLALTLSQSYERRVLLIDGDLRKPSIHAIFDVENVAGLIDALREAKGGVADRKVPVVTVSPRLKLLLSGGVMADPAALLTSDLLQSLLSDASTVFDWIVIDTPPATFLPDCSLIASLVDTVLVVVRARATPYSLVQRAVDAIGRDKIIGIVMNRADYSAGGDHEEHYRYYYYGDVSETGVRRG